MITTIPWPNLTRSTAETDPGLVCPSCSGVLIKTSEEFDCARCRRHYPVVAGLPDLRLESDRYLDLKADRKKAEKLEKIAVDTDLAGLIDAYYVETADVDSRRRVLYRNHILRAGRRGAVLATSLPPEGRILEIGCGSGGLLTALAGSGNTVVGIDIALRWLVTSRRRLADRGQSAPLFAASADRLPWPDASFDVVVADSLLEHLDDPRAAVREWARVLKPGGHLRIWSPNRWSILRDPHVGLWGVGWLPRALASGYVRLRRGCPWPLRVLGPAEAKELLEPGSWRSVVVESAPLAQEMVEGDRAKAAIRLYRRLRETTIGGFLLRSIGPLWQLRATRTEAR